MKDISELRSKLDVIDEKLALLLSERMDAAREVGLYKKQSGFPLNDPEREQKIVGRFSARLPIGYREYAGEIMGAVFDVSKKIQRKIAGNYYVIGKKLPHTWSPDIYRPLGLDYWVKELGTEKDVERFVLSREYDGFNATIPYKQTVMPFLDEIDAEAAAVGAVNTVVNRNGRLFGYNTDVGGMRGALINAGIDPAGKVCAVLGGNGGTAHTARYVLKNMGAARILTVSRTGDINYSDIYGCPVEIIINCTPVGMYPNLIDCPVEPEKFPLLKGVFDAVYNPAETLLVMRARSIGIPAANGLYMLVEQGRLAYNLYTDSETDETVTETLVKSITLDKTNVVIEGMPGSGKTSVGREVARILNKTFVDTDEEIEKAYGKSIPDIFASEGESAFRDKETEAVLRAAALNGAVIATGGGAVLSRLNREVLKRNGWIVYLKRDLSKLESAGRPLSISLGADKLYAERAPIYEAFADFTVENDGIESSAEKIAEAFLKS